ncbi:glycosyltransferase family 2 protein [Planctomonas sp. JC2975]|uniref:glycosyltransferase n=1 Tax=Planctomonas sp. JC2975 TaxID=2729626 RepID=UPI001474758F|nr:glycosyltransferase family 2 protein [Planctomonas sp. JC2975]
MRVVAAVVAYNRRDLLNECLNALQEQTLPLDAVVVVDNASTDDSAEVAAGFPEVDLVRLGVNTGGAGGFAVAIEHALTVQNADLVWVMDDDTIPTPTALEALLDVRSNAREEVSVLASRVVWADGLDHPMNTPRRKPLARASERRDAAAVASVPVRSASFVSALVDAKAVRAHGLPVAEYFLWNDDFEFTARILRHGRGLYVPASVVLHKTKARADTDVDPGPRFYYEVRNKLWLFRVSTALGWYELPLYVASTARRWMRTYRASQDRGTIVRTFRAGWNDGVKTKPRDNGAYLDSLGIDGSSLTTFETARSRGAHR